MTEAWMNGREREREEEMKAEHQTLKISKLEILFFPFFILPSLRPFPAVPPVSNWVEIYGCLTYDMEDP